MFLAAIMFGLGSSRPANFADKGNYALTTSAANALGEESPYVPMDEPRVAEPHVPAPDTADAPKTQSAEQKGSPEVSKVLSPAEAHAARDSYCNFYATAATGNVTPEQAAQREQANGAIAGAIGGAVLGAIFGGSGRHSGRSTALGVGAGLLAGATVGSSNAQLAADDIRKRYNEAYSTCMSQEDRAARQGS